MDVIICGARMGLVICSWASGKSSSPDALLVGLTLMHPHSQCNMDFIFYSAVLNMILLYLILSYDIACQYSKKFWSRMPGLPLQFHLNIKRENLWFKVPNFHLPGHKPFCHSAFSFHYMWGAGRTHGETIEQNWEFTNGAASSTKMMGRGARHAALEFLFAYHNWRRTVSNRGTLASRMAENVLEGQEHRDAFDAALSTAQPGMTDSWKAWVHEWESIQHTNGDLSPFERKEKGVSPDLTFEAHSNGALQRILCQIFD